MNDSEHPFPASPAPTTPHRKAISYPIKLTPQSQNTVSRLKADGSSLTLSEDYGNLQQDVRATKTVTLEKFARIIFNRDSDAIDSVPIQNETDINVKFDAFLAAATKQKNVEMTLYNPLIDLLNTICKRLSSGDTARVFYEQAFRTILGYRLERKPDIGLIYRRFIDLSDDEDLDAFLRDHYIEGMHWLFMLSLVEVKHKNGNTLKTGRHVRKRAKSTPDQYGRKSGSKKQKSTGGLPVATNTSLLPGFQHKATQGNDNKASAPPLDLKSNESILLQETRLQVASYAKALFSAGAIRTHVIALVVDDAFFRFVFYNRSIIVESEPADLRKPWAKRWFTVLVQHLHSLSHEQLGLIPNMEPRFLQNVKLKSSKRTLEEDPGESESQLKRSRVDGKGKGKERVDSQISERSSTHSSTHSSSEPSLFSNNQVSSSEYAYSEATTPPSIRDPPSLVGSTYTLIVEGVKRILLVTDEISTSDGLIGRGTIVLGVECILEEFVDITQRTVIIPEPSWQGKPLVLKLSSPPSGRTKENVLVDAARTHAKESQADWALKHLPLVVGCADRMEEGDDPEGNTLQSRLKLEFGDSYETRSFRATVLEKLEPLSKLMNAREYAQVFYDILQIHRWLYMGPEILHRDLSTMNIMFRREDDQVYGVLNDFDLSSFLTHMKEDGPTSKHRTGTKPFMSRDLLDAEWDKGHLYRHDLESLFYIILIHSCHYSNPTTYATSLPFDRWFDRADQEVAEAKLSFLESISPCLSIQTYFEGFAPWLDEFRLMLGMGYKSRPLRKADPFNWDTLNGHVTYVKMKEVMGVFDGEELVTRRVGGDSDSGS